MPKKILKRQQTTNSPKSSLKSHQKSGKERSTDCQEVAQKQYFLCTMTVMNWKGWGGAEKQISSSQLKAVSNIISNSVTMCQNCIHVLLTIVWALKHFICLTLSPAICWRQTLQVLSYSGTETSARIALNTAMYGLCVTPCYEVSISHCLMLPQYSSS